MRGPRKDIKVVAQPTNAASIGRRLDALCCKELYSFEYDRTCNAPTQRYSRFIFFALVPPIFIGVLSTTLTSLLFKACPSAAVIAF